MAKVDVGAGPSSPYMRFEAEIVRCPKEHEWDHVACDVEHEVDPPRDHDRAYCHGWHLARVKKLLVRLARTYS